jgi:Protein of unknown function (DUF3017)
MSRRRAAPGARRGGPPAAAGRGSQRPRGSLAPYLLVLAGCAAGLAWVAQGGPAGIRRGTLALAGAMFAAALARLVLPEDRAGMLASRKRLTDVVTLAVLAGGLLAAGLALPVPS